MLPAGTLLDISFSFHITNSLALSVEVGAAVVSGCQLSILRSRVEQLFRDRVIRVLWVPG